MLFLKRLNDVFVETAERIEREEGEDYGWYDRDEHQFFVPEKHVGAIFNPNPKTLEQSLTKRLNYLKMKTLRSKGY
ncbi:hypothetical protein JS44_15280 [Anoxybacillus flavithermus]|uniref:Uncharacterized protein n=1 Tax=Anoxybacillus flavithermus TaxID=33934 RepID=A0A094IWX2_9BACL|nr:hypothetical protein JS44_15280 [Anoxybacillus flavithermus]